MPLLFHTTTYKPERAQAEIQRVLLSMGARRISLEYAPGHVVTGMSFTLHTPQGEQEFMLPVRVDRVRETMRKQGILVRSRPDEHSAAVAWRTLLEWVKVQLAIIETQQATPDEIMLPYMLVLNQGTRKSVYEQFTGSLALPEGE